MTLRRTILLSIVLALLALVLVLFYTLESTLLRQYESEETQTILDALQRSQSLLNSELIAMELTSRDWAKWDDSYQYVRSPNSAYAKANLADATLEDLNLHLMAFINMEGNVIYLRLLDPVSGDAIPAPAELTSRLIPGSNLLHSADSTNPRQGLLSTPQGALLLVSHPILRTSGAGPAGGTLLIGRFLNLENLQRLRSVSQLSFALFPTNANDLPADVQAVQGSLHLPGDATWQILDEASAAGFLLLADFDAQPAFILRVDVPRTNFRSRQGTINYLTIFLVMSAVTFSSTILILLESLVLSRLARLNKEVNQIGKSGDLHQRVTVQYKDEIANLSRNINQSLESLEQAQLQRQQADQRFRTLVKSMEDIVLTLDMEGRVTEVFGRSAYTSEILQAVDSGAAAEAEDPSRQVHKSAFAQAVLGQPQVYEWEGSAHGQPFFIQTSLSPMRNEQGEVIGLVSVGRDITRLKLLEQDLQQGLDDLSALFQASRVFLSQLDLQNTYAAAARLAVDALGSQMAWIGRMDEANKQVRLVAAQGIHIDSMLILSLEEEPTSQEAWLIQCALRRQQVCTSLDSPPPQPLLTLAPDLPGESLLIVLPLTLESDSPTLLILYRPASTDFPPHRVQLLQSFANLANFAIQNAVLFEQVRSGRARMRELSSQLVEVQETERRTLAQELHDEIGQLLTGLRLLIESAAASQVPGAPPSSRPMHESLQQAIELSEQLITRVRQLSLDLRPAMLDDLGLLPALAWLFERYTRQTGIQVNFQHIHLEGQRFPAQVEITAYRIIQEALTNIARHTRAEQAWVRLWAGPDSLGVQVEDRGQGFDPEEALERRTSRGLIGMKERIERLGGSFNILSSPKEGTQISAQFPLGENQRSD